MRGQAHRLLEVHGRERLRGNHQGLRGAVDRLQCGTIDQTAVAPSNAPEIAKRLGVRLSSAAFPRMANFRNQVLVPAESNEGRVT